ncbi:AMP-binding protein [Frankia sp. Mgl5]|uniref:AMP-binding protein n=1 Tax=Frankia sp. Mgl5 TaxID=2933793 RepID=UPI002035A904|nr:AMP-binding protein [Frankia sp. Mgl5]
MTRVKVVDEDGCELPCGQVGEIVASTLYTMIGYRDRLEQSATALHGRCLHTGDIGRMEADGYVTFSTARTT